MTLNNCPMKKFEEQTDFQAIIRVQIMNHTHTVVFTQTPLEKNCNYLMVLPVVLCVRVPGENSFLFVTGNF